MNRILAIARKEFIHISRDPRTIISVVLLPVLMLFLFAYALSFDVKNIPTGVLDQDHTEASRRFVDSFTESRYFTITERVNAMSQVNGIFDRGDARAVVIVPPGFGDDIAAGRQSQVAVLLDGSEPNTAQLGQAYAQGLSRSFNVNVITQRVAAQGLGTMSAGGIVPSVRVWYNPEARSAIYLVPGLIVILTMMVTVQQTANTLVRERENGTLEQLIVSPIHRIELMVGKVLPWMVLAGLNVLVISAFGLLVFRVPFRGDVFTFALGAFLFVLCCLGLGLFISSRASSTEVANQIALIVSFLPGFMFSGFVFPLANIPVVLRAASYLFPARYFMVVTRSVFLKGAGLDILWPQILALTVYAVVAVTLSAALYRRRL